MTTHPFLRSVGGRIVVCVLCLLPPLLAFDHIRRYAVSYVAQDSLNFVQVFDAYDRGVLTWGDLFAQHNEHRIFFPRLAMLILGLLTRYDVVAEAYLSFVCLLLGAAAVFLVCRRFARDPWTAAAAFVPASWLLFSLRQSWSLIWGWQLLFLMATGFLLLSLCFLEISSGLDGWWFAAAATGIVASFSLSNMLLVWPIGLAMILWKKRSVPATWGWVLVGLVVWGTYFVHYTKPPNHPSVLYSLAHPWEAFRFLGRYLGACSGARGSLRAVFGVFLLFVYVSSVVRTYRRAREGARASALPSALMMFVLGTVVLTTMSRVGLGPNHALAARYQTFSGLGLVGLYLNLFQAPSPFRLRVRGRDVTSGFWIALLVAVVVPAYAGAAREGEERRSTAVRMAYYVSTTPLQSDRTLEEVYPDAPYVRRMAAVLERLHLNVAAEPPLDPSEMRLSDETVLSCVVDRIMDAAVPSDVRTITVAAEMDTVTLTGWAVDREAAAPAAGVIVEVDGSMDIPSAIGFLRPDVAELLGRSRYRKSGFMTSFAAGLLGEGLHEVRIKVVSADRTRYSVTAESWFLRIEPRNRAHPG